MAARGAAQEPRFNSRGPRFLVATFPGGESDASDAPVLKRRVSLGLKAVTIDEALKEITRQAKLEIAYSRRVVPLRDRVSLNARDITLAAALTKILLDTDVDVSVTPGGALALIPRRHSVRAWTPPDTGSVTGEVRDSVTGSPIVGAMVSIEGTGRYGVSDAAGRYRIERVPEGTHILRARYIGYTPQTATATVRGHEVRQISFALAKSAQLLEQVVVTGTLVPTEVKALPTPVTVIGRADIEAQHPHTVQELFRQAVPGAVSWDFLAAPYTTAFSVRGANTLASGSAQMKVFVDGIEAALPARTPVDPESIERIEVIRGPQAAAIYGSDAIGGVVQIFTKRGASAPPQVGLEAGLGLMQTPYAGFDGVVRQHYAASVHGGGTNVTYNLGANYSRIGDHLPNGEQSRQSSPSVYGGMTFTRDNVSLDVASRYYTQNVPIVFNPELSTTGFPYWSKPLFQPTQLQSQMIGGRLTLEPKRWWRATITAGIDRFTTEVVQSRPRRVTPDDTLLTVFDQSWRKTSIGVSTSLSGNLGRSISGSLTAGFDHYQLPVEQWFTSGALTTTGTITTAPGRSVSASRTLTNNTGYFAQVQLGFHEELYLTGGLRAEQNTNFGGDLGTPLSPRVGLSYVRPFLGGTVKLRTSYGSSIRAPSPGWKLALVTTSTVLANPLLGPERQRGWDVGVETVFGSRASLAVTYYDQTASDLIQLVQLQSAPSPISQYQNVARVGNTGIEIEAAFHRGPAVLKGQYAYSRARVAKLAPNYAGDLRIGDQVLATPRHTGGASLSLDLLREASITVGLTYVGGWSNYDELARYRCLGGTGSCGATTRDYIVTYPDFLKANLTISRQLGPTLSAFAVVDNLTNEETYESSNQLPVMGRITSVGLQVHPR